MVLKTFNLDEEVYRKFSEYCKKEGLSMSKKIENFIKKEILVIEKQNVLENNQEKEQSSKGNSSETVRHHMKRYC